MRKVARPLLISLLAALAVTGGSAAAAAPTTVTVQGDSLTVRSLPYMPADLGSGYRIVSRSAKGGRRTRTGLSLLAHQRLGRVVVFALGTNDWFARPAVYERGLLRAIRMAGPRRCVVLPTLWRNGAPLKNLNDVLVRVARRFGPRRVQLAHWAETVFLGHVQLRDGTHPLRPDDWQVRGEVVDVAVRACVSAPH